MSSKSYAAATAAYAPAPAAQPDHAFLDSLQPANRKIDANHRNSHLDAEHSDDDDQEEAAMGSDKPGASFKATLEGHPAMEDRAVAEEVDHIELAEPYVPRANIAATPEHPDGTVEGGWAKKHEHESVLQQHVHWWDPDHDGVIWPWDTFSGFHQLGFALFWCILSVLCVFDSPAFATLGLTRVSPRPAASSTRASRGSPTNHGSPIRSCPSTLSTSTAPSTGPTRACTTTPAASSPLVLRRFSPSLVATKAASPSGMGSGRVGVLSASSPLPQATPD